MPRVAPSASRRRQVPQDDDEIEQQPSSQGPSQSQIQSSSSQDAVRVRNEKKKKKLGKSKMGGGGGEDHDVDMDDQEEDEERARLRAEEQEDINMAKEIVSLLESFTDHPLPDLDTAARTINLQSQEWTSLIDPRKLEEIMAAYNSTALMIQSEEKDPTVETEAVKSLDKAIRELIDAESAIKAHTTALQTLETNVKKDELNGANPAKAYKRLIDQAEEDYEKKTTRQKYGRDTRYQSFRENIWETGHPNEAMPPLLQTIPREEADESDNDDDEILIGGRVQGYKCPITLTTLVEPVTSTKCSHSYSKASIAQLFTQSRSNQVRCPASGCSVVLTRTDVRPNRDLEMRVKAHVRREKERERTQRTQGAGSGEVVGDDDEEEDEEILDDDD